MSPHAFHFTSEQSELLLNADAAVTALVPAANKRFVIISEDEYDQLRRQFLVDEVDLPFFDCEEIDPPLVP
jgi:hypothetical protein